MAEPARPDRHDRATLDGDTPAVPAEGGRTEGPRGLSAFPLTPVGDGETVDEAALAALVRRLAEARVDSITVLGSTGSYAYLDRDERRRVVEVAVAEAGDVPVLAGVGATRTRDVLRHVADAQAAGAAGVLVAPVSYQPLTDDEVHDLFADVDRESSVPVVVYDNPRTTHVTFTDELYARVAALPHVASLKIPPVPGGPDAVRRRVASLRARVPGTVTIGISGDAVAVEALAAGCDAWYSVLAGTLPEPCRALLAAAVAGDAAGALRHSERLAPVWDLFAAYGSYRVVSALAEDLGLVAHPNLPRPVQGLDRAGRRRVAEALEALRATGVLPTDG